MGLRDILGGGHVEETPTAPAPPRAARPVGFESGSG
jgi:hypothetical protein